MFDVLKKWATAASPEERRREAVSRWARARGMTVRIDPGSGRVVGQVGQGGAGDGLAWTLEWGPSQRSYLIGAELCLRAEAAAASSLQALVLDRPLRARLEREVFESYVQDLQTRVDTRTPPEMRWLVMLPPVPAAATAALGDAFSAVASDGPWASRWLNHTFARRMSDWRSTSEAQSTPFVLLLSRGRLTLRTALESPDPGSLEALAGLLRAAAESAAAASAG